MIGSAKIIFLVSACFWLAGRAFAADPDGRRDIHSQARPDEAKVSYIDLDLTVDFDAKAIRGTALLAFDRPGKADAPLTLDTRGLVIEGVEASPGGPVPHELGPEVPFLGRSLTIRPPAGVKAVRVRYRTGPSASALQWLDPKGTASGKAPFLFTQSQAIHARSWIPVQDSPAIRITYAARVTVPKGLTAVMAADGAGREETPAGTAFSFRMPQAIPPYLVALAVGDLAFRPLGPRAGVWAEPPVVEAAAAEFADTESMIATTERRFGPYRWGRYDLLVLPPSFPFGGMENPKLTFATPTVLAGDRSLVSLVAHELAHSWSGNLVTNATWRDFWLNEGFTTYIERRVMEDLYGVERAEMEWALGGGELLDELKTFAPADQVLHIDLTGRDPDDGMTQVPYEKGALFLRTLEKSFGRDRFDPFLKAYFDRYSFRSITTADFVATLKAELFPVDPAAAAKIDLAAWIESPGLPGGIKPADSPRFAAVDRAAKDWESGRVAAGALPTKDWTTHEWLRFLDAVPPMLPQERLAELDRAFGLTARGNSEILARWLVIAIRNGYKPADARLDAFLTGVGRRKFLMPLYTELNKTPEGRARASALFARARPFYHPIATESVARLLGEPAR